MHTLTPKFKALGSDRRLAIIAFLHKKPQDVQSVARHLRVSLPTASYHLRKLLREGYLREQRYKNHTFFYCTKGLASSKLYRQIIAP